MWYWDNLKRRYCWSGVSRSFSPDPGDSMETRIRTSKIFWLIEWCWLKTNFDSALIRFIFKKSIYITMGNTIRTYNVFLLMESMMYKFWYSWYFFAKRMMFVSGDWIRNLFLLNERVHFFLTLVIFVFFCLFIKNLLFKFSCKLYWMEERSRRSLRPDNILECGTVDIV